MPTGLLMLPVVAVVPWLTADVAAALLWSGAVRLVVWALVIAGAAWTLCRGRKGQRFSGGQRAPAAVGLLAAALMGSFAWAIRDVGTSGDEPHYLLIATSALRDGDIDLANDYTDERHLAFYPGPLSPRHTVLSGNGREYSFHGHGVTALVLPAFAFGGVPFARITMLALSALGVAFLFSAARIASSSDGASFAAIAALVTATPFVAQSAAIYPDGPAAAVVGLVLLTAARLERAHVVGAASLALTGAALALLPWLHLRYSLVSAAFAIAILWLMRNRREWPSDALVFLAAPLVSATLLFASSWVMFETIDPTAPFRQKVSGSLSAAPAGMLGLLTDHEYGLLAYAPVFGLAAIGAAAFVRQLRITASAGIFAFLITLLTGASFVWWGGTTSPARFLVPVLPVLALCIAVWWRGAALLWRAVGVAAIAIGAAISTAVAVADGGRYVINAPDARASIFEWGNSNVDVPAALPSLFRTGARPAQEGAVAGIWLALGAIVMAALWHVHRRSRLEPSSLAAWGIVIWISVSATVTWNLRGGEPRQADRAQLQLLQAAARSWLHAGFDTNVGLTTPESVIRRLQFRADPGVDGVALLAPRVPAGHYRVIVENAPALTATTFSLELGRDASPVHTWTAADQPPEFHLAAPLHSVRVTTDAAAATGVAVRLQPLRVIRTPESPLALHVTRYGPLDVYALDAAPTMEVGGFWLPGNRRTALVVTTRSGEATGVDVTIDSAEAATILLSRGEWQEEVHLGAGGRSTIAAPGDEGVLPFYIDVRGPIARQGVWVAVAPR